MLKSPLVFIFNVLETHYGVYKTSLYDHIRLIFEQDRQECIFMPIRNSGMSTIDKRAEIIDKKLRKIGPAHVIALSVSGVDCRLASIVHSTPMHSLFTISSPHNGSRLATWAWSPDRDLSLLDPISKFLGLPLSGFQEVNTEKLRNINKLSASDKIPIFSTSSWKYHRHMNDLLNKTGRYLQGEENTFIKWNDGVFYTEEMKWGSHLLSFDGDHTDLVGCNLKVNCAPLYRLALDNAKRLELHEEGKIAS
jgi:hypothetical protein